MASQPVANRQNSDKDCTRPLPGSEPLRFGVVGGRAPQSGADIATALKQAMSFANRDADHPGSTILRDCSVSESGRFPQAGNVDPKSLKITVYNSVKTLITRGVNRVLLASFFAHTFIRELQAEFSTPIIDMMDALAARVACTHPHARTLGILATGQIKKTGLFERYFGSDKYRLLYPSDELCAELDSVLPQIDQRREKNLEQEQHAIDDLVRRMSDTLIMQGADLILPGSAAIAGRINHTRSCSTHPLVDSLQSYAQHAITESVQEFERKFEIGIVGGIGPAATVDFMSKVISETPAANDKDHIKMVVEHNPQIPDRTDHLVAGGPDPTIALYAACKRLEERSPDVICLPCNTAHAFLETIKAHIDTPILDMIEETLKIVKSQYPDCEKFGLLATTGTLRARVYHDPAAQAGLDIIEPDSDYQALVMRAIYGEKGVKAGFLDGQCVADFRSGLKHLIDKGARCVVLGCTELPLLCPHNESYDISGTQVAILDPTLILARKCVELSDTSVLSA